MEFLRKLTSPTLGSRRGIERGEREAKRERERESITM